VAFDWREFLQLAKALRSFSVPSFSAEAAKRSAVSRAYYAAFCHTRNYAEKHLGFQRTRSGKDHGFLRKHLGQQGPYWKQIEDELRDLHEWRKRCDYDDAISNNLDIMVANAISTTYGCFITRINTECLHRRIFYDKRQYIRPSTESLTDGTPATRRRRGPVQ